MFQRPDDFISGGFQLGGQELPYEEEKWDLAGAEPLPDPTNLSPSPPDGYVAPSFGMHSFISLSWKRCILREMRISPPA
jgi:hypothetical protein